MNKWNNKFRYQVASRWLFILSHATMHGSMNIKKNILNLSHYFIYRPRTSTTFWDVNSKVCEFLPGYTASRSIKHFSLPLPGELQISQNWGCVYKTGGFRSTNTKYCHWK